MQESTRHIDKPSLGGKLRSATLSTALLALLSGTTIPALATELYMDTETKQVFTSPGANRVKVSEFEEVEAGVAKTKLGEKGLEIETKDGDFKLAIGGRLQLDGQFNKNESNILQNAKLNSGGGLRRGRMHMEGTVYKDYDFKYEYDFVRGSGTTAAGVTDAWVEYTNLKPISFTVGQFKEPFSLESITSNRYLTFVERSAPSNAFVEWANAYMLGISAQSFGERYTARGAFQAEPIGGGSYANNSSTNSNGNANRNTSNGNTAGNPSHGVTARATFLPIYNSKTELLHLGAAGSYRHINNTMNGQNSAGSNGLGGTSTGMSFASQVSNVDRTNWANTGVLTDALTGANGAATGVATPNRRVLENFSRVGVELSGVYGPASFQAEYIRTQLRGQNYSSNDHLDGYYAYVSYFLTGESRNYDNKKGAFGRQKPNRNFDRKNGGSGAWEIATRFDSLDMNTQHVSGGHLQSGTIALNWYLNPHVRLMADYTRVITNKTIPTIYSYATPTINTDRTRQNTDGQNPTILMVRTQIDW